MLCLLLRRIEIGDDINNKDATNEMCSTRLVFPVLSLLNSNLYTVQQKLQYVPYSTVQYNI